MTELAEQQTGQVGQRLRVLYVMGSGRSGSTLLSSMLGTQHDVLSVGEVYNFRNFFQSAGSKDRHCSCGEPLLRCPIWTDVRGELEGAFDDPLIDLKDTRDGVFERHNQALFEALVKVSGCQVIVDSSKRHYRLSRLASMPGIDLTILHLVRDPRAYAYSSLVTARQRGQSDMAYYIKLMEWLRKNFGIRYLYGSHSGYMLLRYEDLVADREHELRRVLDRCNLSLDKDELYDERNRSHEFSGNKRFISKGLAEIRLDTRYLGSLSGLQWVLGSLIVLPACMMFGYPLLKRKAPV